VPCNATAFPAAGWLLAGPWPYRQTVMQNMNAAQRADFISDVPPEPILSLQQRARPEDRHQDTRLFALVG
jgi:hypothetical protein